MALFSVGYDLIKDKDYEKIHNGIKAVSKSWAKPLESHYVVEYDGTAYNLAKALMAYLDKDDKLFVTKLSKPQESAWTNIPKNVTDWLNARVN